MTAGALPRRGESTPALRALGALARGYSAIFAAGPLAPVLSPSHPVRHQGFDLGLVVDDVQAAAEGVAAITLRRGSGAALPAWTPGAHVEVVTPAGRVRHYSLCGDPRDRQRYRIAVRHLEHGRGGSAEMHALRSGDPVTARGPRNAFPLLPRAPGHLFIAAGIGITPILPMVRAVAAGHTPWQLAYLGRSRSAMPFLGELSGLPPGRVRIYASDERARPSVADLLRTARSGDAVYVCGPAPMLDEALREGPRLIRQASLHLERFSAPEAPPGQPFTIVLRRSGHTLQVGARQTALEAVRAVLPDLAYSCAQGFCGTCRTRVLAGQVEHHDRVLRPGERAGEMTLCVSRGTGGTLLEVDL